MLSAALTVSLELCDVVLVLVQQVLHFLLVDLRKNDAKLCTFLTVTHSMQANR